MKTIKKTLIFLCILWGITGLASCGSNILSTDCDLPCWNGIIPGQTSENETLKLLEKIDGYSSTRIEKDSEIVKLFSDFHNDILFMGSVEDGVIYEVSLRNAKYWQPSFFHPSIRLKSILYSAGEPDEFFIGSMSSGDVFTLDAFLLYPDLNMIVAVEVKGEISSDYVKIKMDGRGKISSIYLLSPDKYESKIKELHFDYGLPNNNKWHKWNGLIEYE